MKDATWFALGVAATLLAAYVAHKIGRLQIKFMRHAHELNVQLATCQIGSKCRIESRAVNNRPFSRYWLLISLYNTGQLAATKLKGNCTVVCSDSVHDRQIPVTVDSLGNTMPHELEPQEFCGNTITQAIRSGNFRIDVDIQFEFIGLDDKTPEKYAARYEYSGKQHQMVRS